MAERDPGAVTELRLSCPACGRDYVVSFDIASFLWSEIEAKAPRLLLEVHDLASAYGWAEAEILALAPWRRSFYRAMAARFCRNDRLPQPSCRADRPARRPSSSRGARAGTRPLVPRRRGRDIGVEVGWADPLVRDVEVEPVRDDT
jgi:hypothetical protein